MKKRQLYRLLLALGLCGLIGGGIAQARPAATATTALTIAASPWPLAVNQGALLAVVATNLSGENADNVVITAAIPNNMSLTNVTTTQGQINVYNSAVTVYAGTLGAGQSMQVAINVVVVASYPTDAPFNLCAAMTYLNGTARLSCLPNQPAGSTTGNPPATLPPNGQRPIYDPNRPPVYLPVSGAPIDLLGPIAMIGGLASLVIGLLRRKIR